MAFQTPLTINEVFLPTSTANSFIFSMRDYLTRCGLMLDQSSIRDKITARKNGKTFSFAEHLQGLVYSLLSKQRQWSGVLPHLTEINRIFYDYDANTLLSVDLSEIECNLLQIRCGNKSLHKQLESLKRNIEKLLEIARGYGSLDSFVTPTSPNEIVKMISHKDSLLKLEQVGKALAWEYLRNVGIDGAKPDIHLRRFLGAGRLGYSKLELAKEGEVFEFTTRLSEATGLLLFEIDNIIWSFCSHDYGDICSAKPKCEKCVVKREYDTLCLHPSKPTMWLDSK